MAIYTKSGDNLLTDAKEGRVYKSDLIIEIEGTLDEAETSLALAKCEVAKTEIRDILLNIIKELFDFGSDLLGYSKGLITTDVVSNLEGLIDTYQNDLKDINKFVIPGETKEGALIHTSRVTIRRLERRIVEYAKENEVSKVLLEYINRLSDLLFTLARWVDENA